MAHCVCAIVTYLVWWDKPFNITEPTLISGQHAREACALLTMASSQHYSLFGLPRAALSPEFDSIDIDRGVSPGAKLSPGSLSHPGQQAVLLLPAFLHVDVSYKSWHPTRFFLLSLIVYTLACHASCQIVFALCHLLRLSAVTDVPV